jgi:ATP-dependent exoDNAse (exonuclease V) beta subunit
MIRASAGTGKTFQLSNRYLALAAAGAQPDRVLASTFTRKAAGEILDRVLVRLARSALDEKECTELAESIGNDGLNPTGALELLANLVKHLHRLRISTLDGFFAQLAASFGLELALPPGWRIVEEPLDQRMRREAISAVLAADDVKDTLTLMHLLSRGEASRSVSDQIADLVNDLYGVYLETPPAAWRALPNWRPLDGETLAVTLGELAAAKLPDLTNWMKARHADLEAAQAGDWAGFIHGGLAGKIAAGDETFGRRPIEPHLVAIYRKLLDHAKAMLVRQLADQTEATFRLLEKFDAQYQRLKQARRAFRFDDITRSLAHTALSARPGQLAYRLDAELSHLLLDEFQDTSLWQWQVLGPLAEQLYRAAPPAAGRDGASFFCVGDSKQAIYGWRGGVAELAESLARDWPLLQQESLNRSWRSAQVIIDTVNRVFEHLDRLPALQHQPSAVAAWTHAFVEHTTARGDLTGYARLVTAPKAGEGEKQDHVTLAFAADEIVRLAQASPSATIAALVRDNAAVARLIYELRRRGLRASEEGGNPLADSPAVGAVLSLLTLADHPGDTVALFHVAHSPLAAVVGLDETAVERSAIRLSHRVRRSLVTEGYGKTIHGWVRRLADACDQRDAARLSQLVELAHRYQDEATLRVRDFVEYVESQKVADPTSADVRVMTIHQAKGLEFDIVVLPQLDGRLSSQAPRVIVGRADATASADLVTRYANKELQALLPANVRTAFDRHEQQVLSESFCVLYVAMTRAIHALHMIVAPSAENEKGLPAKYSGILRATLTDGRNVAPGTTLYEVGVPEGSWQKAERRGAAAGGEASIQNPIRRSADKIQYPLLAPGQHRARMLERQSPSGLEGGTLVDLKQRMRLDAGAALLRGTVVHAWFEQVEWLDDGEPNDEALRHSAFATGASPGDVAVWLAQFREMLAKPNIRAALLRGDYESGAAFKGKSAIVKVLVGAPYSMRVLRERSFAIRDSDTILTGALDRLVLLERDGHPLAADIVDFKTDVVAGDEHQALEAVVDHYRPQVEAYRRAVARFSGLATERIAARLLFVGPGIGVRV